MLTTIEADNAKMRLYIRNIFGGSLLFLTLTFLRTAVYLNRSTISNAGSLDEDISGSRAENPRFRRNVLWDSTTEKNAELSSILRLKDGPEIDLGTAIPQKWGSDVFITVKTTHKFHNSRLKDIVETWFRLAPNNTYIVTDQEDATFDALTGGHLINSNCSSSHHRQALCCKMGVEFDLFIRSGRSWFCHFDDDNYVNVPELMRLLSAYDPRKDWYLGRPSTRGPIEIIDRGHMSEKISFWFATGGAGFCVSRSLASKMQPYAGDGKFIALGERIRLPDDVTMGFLIEHLLGRPMTVVDKFHSHLESMRILNKDTLHEQVSVGSGSYNSQQNVVTVNAVFSESEDPSRFRSLHCFLFPRADICRRKRRKVENTKIDQNLP